MTDYYRDPKTNELLIVDEDGVRVAKPIHSGSKSIHPKSVSIQKPRTPVGRAVSKTDESMDEHATKTMEQRTAEKTAKVELARELRGKGMKPLEIAKQLGIHEVTVYSYLKL